MNKALALPLITLLAMLCVTPPVKADEKSDDAADVWTIVEQLWIAEDKGDKDWVEKFLTDDFSGWTKNSPAPRNKAAMQMWDRVYQEHGKSITHELYPLSIVVHGDVAIVHYLYSAAYQDAEDKFKVNNGRFTDILVRTSDGWKFLAWHGGDD